jgi:hypothetical protein
MLPSRQIKKKKYLDPATVLLVKQILLGLFVFAVVGTLITIVFYVTRISSLTIKTIQVDGGITISEDLVRYKVEEKLVGAYLRLIPRRFAYFYPEQEILASVSTVERIKDVRVERISNQEIKISFNEYLPDSLWCSLGSDKKCYFFDENGFSFALAPTLSGESMVRYYSSENVAELGKIPFSESDYATTKEFIRLLSGIGWYITKVEINSARDVFYTLSQGSELKATLNEEVSKTFSNLETILGSKEFGHLKPGNFQYVDLRFGTRVFVNEELLSSLSITTATTTIIESPSDPE